MNRGTKSLLFGVHQVLWHPVTVWRAWRFLYGARPTWRETVCIVIHDFGYWGCPEMDGPEGIDHPHFGAELAGRLFDDEETAEWYLFCLGHSRHLSKKLGLEPSKLCWADKCSMLFDPEWFYLFRARLTGELAEYRMFADKSGFCPAQLPDRIWLAKLRAAERARAVEKAAEFLTQ